MISDLEFSESYSLSTDMSLKRYSAHALNFKCTLSIIHIKDKERERGKLQRYETKQQCKSPVEVKLTAVFKNNWALPRQKNDLFVMTFFQIIV